MKNSQGTLGLDPSFVEEEELVSKLQLIQDLECVSPYHHRVDKDMRYFERCERAISAIPSEHYESAWALFANVIYLPQELLDSSWPHLLNQAARRLGVPSEEIVDHGLLLEADAADLRYRFIQKCNIGGRLDTDQFPRNLTTVSSLLSAISGLASSEERVGDQRDELLICFKKKFWVLLTDYALSGTSLSSEIKKIFKIFGLLEGHFPSPRLVILIQVLTEDGETTIATQLGSKLEDVIYVPVIRLGPEFKINSDNCDLFNRKETRVGILRFCEWFAQNTFLASDPKLVPTKKLSGDDLQYGFKASGLGLVTPNCPSNSVPPLWYPTVDTIQEKERRNEKLDYIPPFPRLHSRYKQTKSKDKELLEVLQQSGGKLLRKLK